MSQNENRKGNGKLETNEKQEQQTDTTTASRKQTLEAELETETNAETANVEQEAPPKPTPQERRNKILEIIAKKEKKNENIKQNEVLKDLEKFFGVKINQTVISKDFKRIGIEQRRDRTGFKISSKAKRTLDVEKLKKIANDFHYTADDVCPDIKTLLVKSKGIANSHILGSHLMLMYPEIIIDVLCNENSVIVYYHDTPAFRRTSLESDIKSHFPRAQV